MVHTQPRALRWSALTLLWLAFTACSVDAKKNPLWREKCEPGEERYKGFCLKPAGMDGGFAGEPCDAEGAQRLCYDGDAETARQSPCKPGLQTCLSGSWSVCDGQVLPALKETCNGSDDDCDSKIDEEANGAACATGLKGICEEGIEFCSGGVARCRALEDPRQETCPSNPELAQDVDCDGLTGDEDPNLTTACYDGPKGCTKQGDGTFVCDGICQPGMMGCSGVCLGAVYPAAAEAPTMPADGGVAEILDEDCDGMQDEGFACTEGAYTCTTIPAANRGKGTCKPGQRICSDGGLGACENEIKPEPETCANRGADNDCDGVMGDDIPGLDEACTTSGATGECGAKATWKCEGNELKCVAAEEMAEVCGDGKDNDCNGATDNVCGGTGTCCGPACVNTMQSNLHCGGCNQKCEGASSCCNGGCVNLQADNANCGACGNVCTLLNLGLLGGLVQTKCRDGVCQAL